MRRIAWAGLAAALLLAAAVGWWLAQLAEPRHHEFLERRGTGLVADLETPQTEPGGFVSQGVTLHTDTGLRIDARVLRPTAQHRPLPVVVLLGGHRTGRDAVRLIGHPGEAVMVALDYPYHGATRIDSGASFLRSINEVQETLLNTPPAASVVLDWLESQPWADTGRAELVGVSFGAPFVAVAGALDTRFTRVWIIHGGAGNRGWIEHNLDGIVRPRWLRPIAASLIHLLIHGSSFDTEAWVARIAPRPVVIIGARDDRRLPEHKVRKLYEAAQPPKELIWTEGGHVHPRRPDLVQPLLGIVRERIAAGPAQVVENP
jgi:dienelactone hydrolase